MSTQPQPNRAEINKQNAQNSTGPRTAAGKERVRHNAVKHGLTSQTLYLPEGEAERYQYLLNQLFAIHQPQTDEELDLVQKLVDAEWKASTASAMYMNLVALSTSEHMEEFADYQDQPAAQRCLAQAAGLHANARLFEQLSRHEGRFNRMYEKTERRLRELIAERKEQERQLAQIEAQKQAQEKAAKQTQPDPTQTQKPTQNPGAQPPASHHASQNPNSAPQPKRF